MKQIFYLTMIVCALCLSGCGTSSEVSKNAETNTAANSSVPNTAVNSDTNKAAETEAFEKAKNEIVNSTKKLKDLKFWSAKTMSEVTPMLNGEMKFVAPDRFYLKQGNNEAIVIGKNSYIKDNGKWIRSPEDLSGLKEMSQGAMSEEVIKKIKNVREVGKVTLDGKETTLYEHKTVENGMESTTKMWIATDSGLLLKSERESVFNGKGRRLTVYFDYEKPVTIEAPEIK